MDIERLRDAYREAKQTPADEVTFKWLRLNMLVSSTVAWIPDKKYVSLTEGMELYSIGMATFRKLAEEAGAAYKVNKRVLVNTVEFEENLQKYRM